MKQYVENEMKVKIELPPKEGNIKTESQKPPVKKEVRVLFE